MHAVRIVMHRIGLDYLAPIFLATSAGAIGVAWLSARYYESLFMGIKERFVRRRSAPQTAETSQGAGPAVSPASS